MDVDFADEGLRDLCERQAMAGRRLGKIGARRLRARLADLLAAGRVAGLVAGHPHPLAGNRAGQFAVDLDGGRRLVFEPDHDPVPCKEDGSIDWAWSRGFALYSLETTMTSTATPFNPDWASPPGDTISDLAEERGWTQAELAGRLGYTTKHVSQLVNGRAAVTEDTALRLERVLGGPAHFWLTREAQYRAQCARLTANRRLGDWTDWCDRLPIRELMRAGAILKRRVDSRTKPELVEELLRFFSVASPAEWAQRYAAMEVAYRRTRAEQSDVGAISVWLRLGEVEAEKLDGPNHDRARFERALGEIRGLTIRPPEEFEPRLRALCQESGVAFVLVPAIPRAHVSGAARWLSPHRPLIQLSLYGKTNDRFWFTLFHEAAHILLHSKKDIFLDDLDGGQLPASSNEDEANAWAGGFLIPHDRAAELPFLQSKVAVTAFARSVGIHPGIVVGRLQHDGLIEPSWMNDLKVSFRFADNSQSRAGAN